MSRNYIALLAAIIGIICLAVVLKTGTGSHTAALNAPAFISSSFPIPGAAQ